MLGGQPQNGFCVSCKPLKKQIRKKRKKKTKRTMENLSRQSPINKTISIYTKKSCLPKTADRIF